MDAFYLCGDVLNMLKHILYLCICVNRERDSPRKNPHPPSEPSPPAPPFRLDLPPSLSQVPPPDQIISSH